jgi:uncharacterized protein YqeY
MINIDELIKDALKSKEADKLKAYRNLKAKIMEYKTAKNAKPYDNQAEIQIIKKMCDSLKESENNYKKANRQDLFDECIVERRILENFLPVAASAEEIELAVRESEHFVDGKINKKSMGLVIKEVKSKFDFVDGKLVSEIVKKFIND